MTWSIVNTATLVIFAFCAYRLWTHFAVRRGLPLPPGPRGWPIVGNLFDIPKEGAALVYMNMSEKYQSDLLYLNVLGTSIVVLNTAEATHDLFVGRSTMYSDRPELTMANLVGLDGSVVFSHFNESWRQQRSLFLQEVSSANLEMYQKPCMKDGIYKLLNNLLETPEDMDHHVHYLYGGTILSLAYGITHKDPYEIYLEACGEGMRIVSEVTSFGKYLVDAFPAMEYLPGWLPGMGYRAYAAKLKPIIRNMIESPMVFAKNQMTQNGAIRSSIASRLLQEMQDDGTWSEEKELMLTEVLGALYGAGTDTLTATTKTLILALLLHPEFQKRGQAAVDAVVGLDRLPDYTDEGKIPYVDALVMEILRWRPVTPLAIAHHTASADIYKGYYIPANTVVIGNTWSILHNPAVYGEDAEEFNPERFLNEDGSLNRKVPYPSAVFGYGKRTCAGKNVAQSALWLSVASLLACFNISRTLNDKGEEIYPSTEFEDGVILSPQHFKCVIKPRSKTTEGLIRHSREEEGSE
ncbi:hypothetical protein D9757_009110 [Collybiopsis confluens]|uniref:Cytochrome P450 n=1 Tax=Collybiopsis confluens TaxID=2823264 RepID=A0A8H5M345_9AGAR|nr:hypothetical protein D9757_009110 [Collybiopsis confluens]